MESLFPEFLWDELLWAGPMSGSLSEVVLSGGPLLEVPVGLRPSPAKVLALSVALAAALPFTRAGRLILYPFSLLRTWVHELGHAIGAYLVGGRVKEITLHANLMGFAHSICPNDRLARAIMAAAGPLMPTIAGGAVLVASVWGGSLPVLLASIGGGLLVACLIWVRNPFGFGAGLCLGLLYLGAARYLGGFLQFTVVQFSGVYLVLDSISGSDYLFTKFVQTGEGRYPSDTRLMANALFLPYWCWGLILSAASILVLASSGYLLLQEMSPETLARITDMLPSLFVSG